MVEEADRFLAAWPPGSDPQGDDLTEAERLKDLLDAYDNPDCLLEPEYD